MHSALLPVLLLLSIVPQYILAASDGNENTRKQEVTAMAQVALPIIANGLHDRYRKTLGTMKYYHKQMTPLDKRFKVLDRVDKHLLKHKLPWSTEFSIRRARKAVGQRREEVEKAREKHLDRWRKASDAAGIQRSANHLIYDTVPEHVRKGIRRPDDTPQRALQLVGKHLQKTWVTAAKSSISQHELSEEIAKELDRLHEGKLIKFIDMQQFIKMTMKKQAHETLRQKDVSAAMRALYANRVLALTTNGVNPIQLQEKEQWALKRSREYAKVHPGLPGDAGEGEGRTPMRDRIGKGVREFIQRW